MSQRPSPIPSRVVRAAGAVTWRFIDEGGAVEPGQPVPADAIEVLVVHRPRYKDWSWPKGKAEHNESIPLAAVREVEEETGVVVDLRAPLTTQRYRLGTGQTKEVYYWIGQEASKTSTWRRARRPVAPASAREIDRARWMSTSKAMKLLTRRGDRRLLEEVMVRAAAGTLVTATVGLLRHAKAVSRGTWQKCALADGLVTFGDIEAFAARSGRAGHRAPELEATRPLTRLGGRQALDVVDLLSAFGIGELVASPWARCRNTLLPYAGVASLGVSERPELTEAAVDADPAAARKVMKKLMKRGDGAVAVSVHRPTIPVLMEPLQKIAPSALVPDFPTESPWLQTAEMLVAHIAHPADAPAAPVKPNPALVFGGGKPPKPEPGAPMLMALERHGTYTRLTTPG